MKKPSCKEQQSLELEGNHGQQQRGWGNEAGFPASTRDSKVQFSTFFCKPQTGLIAVCIIVGMHANHIKVCNF
jgi:hypothetical protein